MLRETELFNQKNEKLKGDMIVIVTQVKYCWEKKQKTKKKFVMSVCLWQEVTS